MAESASMGREGEVLKGKYALEERLGVGGMGEVYRASNVLVDRTVAIKLLHRELARDPLVVERFLREARAANLVRHRNIVDVLDIDTDDEGVMFIVQEFLEGEDLATRMADGGGKLAPDEALDVLIPIAEAVGAAHARGLVHRDLKPDNIFLALVDDAVVPKVLDFGISKLPLQSPTGATPGRAGKGQLANVRLTSVAGAVGTPAYMSPEQIKDPVSVDARSDVWSLGVMLYETLSGRLPFAATDLGGLFAEICAREPPALDKLVPELPRELGRIVSRCLQLDPKLRFADATELARTLARTRRQREGASEPEPSSLPPTSHAPASRRAAAQAPGAQPAPAATQPRSTAPANPGEWELGAPAPSGSPSSHRPSMPVKLPLRRSAPPPQPAGGISDWDSVDTAAPALELEVVDRPPPRAQTSEPPVAVGLGRASQHPAGQVDGSRPPPSAGAASLAPPSSRPASQPSSVRSSAPAARALPPTDDDLGGWHELDIEHGADYSPSSSASPRLSTPLTAPATPRAARPRAFRTTNPSPTVAEWIRTALAALLFVALAWLVRYASPEGVVAATDAWGADGFAPFGVAGLVLVAAGGWLLVRAGRAPSACLLGVGLATWVVAGAGFLVACVMAAPGLVPSTWRALALLAAPWACVAALLLAALHALLRARELRHPPRHATAAGVLVAAAVGAAGLAGWVALTPRASFDQITLLSASPSEARARRGVRAFGMAVLGAQAVGSPRRAAAPSASAVSPPLPAPRPIGSAAK